MLNELATTDQCALAECEAIIERGRDTFIEVGNALLRIREERLYRAEFGTFQEYCEAKWGMSKTHANRLIDAAEIAENLTPTGVTPSSERAARPLKSLPPRVQRRRGRKPSTLQRPANRQRKRSSLQSRSWRRHRHRIPGPLATLPRTACSTQTWPSATWRRSSLMTRSAPKHFKKSSCGFAAPNPRKRNGIHAPTNGPKC